MLTNLLRQGDPYLISGRTSILRKRISAPSDWKWILPLVRLDLVPTLTT